MIPKYKAIMAGESTTCHRDTLSLVKYQKTTTPKRQDFSSGSKLFVFFWPRNAKPLVQQVQQVQ